MANRTARSSSRTDETQAGAATRGTTAGAGSEAAGVGAGTAEGGVGAQGRFAQVETGSDIGQNEAFNMQMKRLVANELTHDSSLDHQERGMAQATVSAYQQMVQTNAAVYNRILQNAVTADQAIATALNDAVQKTTRTSLFEIDKLENVDEVNALATALISKVTEEVLKKVG